MCSLSNLNFDNKALETLPVDKLLTNQSRTVPGACFSLVDPTPVEKPALVAHSTEALSLLGVSEADVANGDFVEYFSGNQLYDGSVSAAHCYCGHQFGFFSGQLGDGAAMYLGEVVNAKGERWEFQLKGAGKTPFSRNSDGRKVLRSSIREFLCSEAMHHLGVPTTRAGACVTSDTRVVRDIHYDGNPIRERCTIVSRIAPTFLRFGSFEIFKPEDPQTGRSGPSVGQHDILDTMLEYAVNTFFPDVVQLFAGDDKKKHYLEFYKEVVRRTAKMVAMWQCVGFCHGVLNTDNMSIMGITIDYGPYGFMDYFDADYICNASDNKGRYTYKKQPEICKWNLMKFAEALQYALPLDEMKAALNEIYDVEFGHHYYGTMRRKIGITQKEGADDETLIQKMLLTMHKTACDFTNLFHLLENVDIEQDNSSVIDSIVSQCQDVEGFKKRSNKNVNPQLPMLLKIAASQPGLLVQLGVDVDELREQAAEVEKGKELLKLTQEEKKANDVELWTQWIREYRERLKLETQDMSDVDIKKFKEERKQSMQSVNPKVILRNHLAQEAIQLAEEGDYSKVRDLLTLLKSPYSTNDADEKLSNTTSSPDSCAPAWASDLQVT